MAKQILGRVSVLFKGEYEPTTNYEKLDIVSYNGSSYACLKESVGVLPTDTNYWQLVAKKGEQGLQGEKGEQGERGLQGEQGIQGLQGEKGEKGIQGERGLQGEQGIQGIQGENGKDGYTPVRGTDYWTEEDIATIEQFVNDTMEQEMGNFDLILDDIINGTLEAEDRSY